VKDEKDPSKKLQEEPDPELEALLDFLKKSRGFDFTGYKRASVRRRIDKRMQEIDVARYSDYIDELEVRPEEFVHLFNFILINVTGFFRDPQIWTYLASDIIPNIVGRRAGQPIRAWSAGCASGEEAYSIAMLLADAIGDDAFKERVKIYGTDVDEEALTQARAGVYPPKALDGVPAAMRSKFFEQTGTVYSFNKDLRRALIFGRHDLVQDPPISRIDLILCRNALMYFNAETQAQVMTKFNYALNDGGFLVLGKAEMPFTRMRSFSPVDLKRRVFAKEGEPDMDNDTPLMRAGEGEAAGHLANHVRSREAAFDLAPIPQIVIDRTKHLILANERARALCNIAPADVGRPFQDLEVSYKPIDLRTPLDDVLGRRRSLSLGDVTFTTSAGETSDLAVELSPLFDPSGSLLGVGIAFMDVTQRRRLQVELEHSNQELETALEELQSTNEELETTNEELQSTNEELETTNEELQSTNEELETMNEELQATNEELQTVNTEARETTSELDRLNTFFGSILMSLNAGIAVLDQDSNILVWNRRAEDLWGLREGEVVGQPFFDLDIGLPQGDLSKAVADVLEGGAPQVKTLDAVNRRGRSIKCRVEITRLEEAGPGHGGVIVLMEPRE
jgi:two-component system CheB/CheR fusion protein